MRRAFKTDFYIRGNYANKTGKCPIMIFSSLDGKKITIGSVGVFVDPKNWDKVHQQVRGKTTESLQLNQKLYAIKAELHAIAEKLEFEDALTLDKVKSVYQGDANDGKSIANLFETYIDYVKEQVGLTVSDTTYSKYSLCQERFMEMLKKRYHAKDMLLRELTPMVITDYKTYLMSDVGQCNNTAVKALKTLRTVIIYGMKLGLIHTDPYIGVKMHMEKVDRGFLTEEEIGKLLRKNFTISRLELVRDIFLFSCFTGLAYIDVTALKPEHIVTLNGVQWIISKRIKTGTPINVILSPAAKMLIKKYENDPRRKNHIFPNYSNQKTNLYLKEIATACGIDKELTFHMARHTFATLTLSKGVPIESVSRMLGHTNIKTTQIYARITNKKIENDMKKFFADDKIMAFNKETEKMIEEEEKNKKECSSKKDDASSTETPSASKSDEDASKTKGDAAPKRRGRKPKGGKA